jgi:hypothetical protein
MRVEGVQGWKGKTMTPETKTYFPAVIREKSFASGKSILTLGIPVDEFIELLKQHRKPSGWINLAISSRKQVGPKGQTHCIWLDTWEPTKQQEGTAIAQNGGAKASQPANRVKTAQPVNEEPDDDVPF